MNQLYAVWTLSVWTGANINNTHHQQAARITCAPSQARDLRKNASPLRANETPLPATLWASASALAGTLDLHNMCTACSARGERGNTIPLAGRQWKCSDTPRRSGTIAFKPRIRGRSTVCGLTESSQPRTRWPPQEVFDDFTHGFWPFVEHFARMLCCGCISPPHLLKRCILFPRLGDICAIASRNSASLYTDIITLMSNMSSISL